MGLLNRLGAALSSDADPAALRQEISRLERELASQSQINQSSQLLQAVVDAAPVAIVVLDEIGKISFTNATARDLFFEGGATEAQNFLLR